MKTALTVVAHITLAAAGVVIYLALHCYATAERGYVAYGGEIFALAIPILAAYNLYRISNKQRKEKHYVED